MIGPACRQRISVKLTRTPSQAEGRTPFDLENGPLLRVRIQRRAADNYLITFTAHHLIMDGWSLWVFLRDFGHFYSAEISGTEPNLPPANQYRDYSAAMAEYHESDEGRADEEFWVSQFQDNIPVLELPTDRSRPPLKTFDAARVDHSIDVQLIGELKKIGAKNGCSLFNTMLAGFQAFLARVTQQDDLVVGIPTAGQAALDQQDLIGHCVNSIPFRQTVDVAMPMLDYAKQVRGSMLDLLDHQKYTFGSMLKKIAPPRDTKSSAHILADVQCGSSDRLRRVGVRGSGNADLHRAASIRKL